MSRLLVNRADLLERGLLSYYSDKVKTVVLSRRNNVAFKIFVGLLFTNYLLTRSYNKERKTLTKKSNSTEECDCNMGLYARTLAFLSVFSLF